jgi:hypothetical protein
MRVSTALAALVAGLVLIPAPAAATSPPEEITIEGPSYFDGSGEFTTTGGDGLLSFAPTAPAPSCSSCRFTSP